MEEGAEIRPLGGDASAAIVRFFDGSQVTVEGHGQLVLERMRRPRFPGGEAPRSVHLRFARGDRAPAIVWVGPRGRGAAKVFREVERLGLGDSFQHTESMPQADLVARFHVLCPDMMGRSGCRTQRSGTFRP